MNKILPSSHHIGVKLRRTDGEIRRVVSQGIMHLAEGDAVSHHHIGRGVGSREKVLYLLAGLNVPFRNAAFSEHLHHIFRDSLSFSHIFHSLEGKQRIDTVMNEIHHDIITR